MTVKTDHKQRGFTLIEVMIATALFAATATVLIMSFVNALKFRDHAQSNDIQDADIRAVRMQLLLEPNREDAEDGNTFETLNSGDAEWSATIEPTNVVDLFQVIFEIQFSEPQEGKDPTYSEVLYLLRPTWSESDERSDLLQDKKEALQDSRDFDSF
ncbi:MAG: prepilin-type N-terminal cleavage/methylation domain-containing protein [Opitutaceae bacterium]